MEVESDIIIPIKFPSGETIEAGINIRPFCRDLLKEISKYFEIIIFTASHESYASKVIEYLDPDNLYVDHKLYRDHCITTDEGVNIKDLRILANRDLKDLLLVDNAAYSFG